MMSIDLPPVHHRTIDIDGVKVFYRETDPAPDAPVLVLLHGFPSASHQYARLIDAIGNRYRIIAPDYPGFGHTEAPADYEYTFDNLADTVEQLLRTLEIERFAMYLFDFGGPVGLRVAQRLGERVSALVVQNANAYEAGLSAFARDFIALTPETPGADAAVHGLFTLESTRGQHEGGTADPSLVAPDTWTLDQHFLDLPGRAEAQAALAYDYKSNLARYPEWQAWLREHQPPTLIVWGENDMFFPAPGALAYREDLPDAEIHLLDTGHFALGDRLNRIAGLMTEFLDRTLKESTAPPQRIALFGASGRLGSAIATEAEARGHQVTRLGRDDADVTDADDTAKAVAGHDAVIAAVKGSDGTVAKGAAALLDALPRAGVDRLVFVGGGASLEAAPGRRYLDSPHFPAEYVETATDQARALELLRDAATAVNWTYVSPPPMFLEPGGKTGVYRVEARDTPLTGADGEARISVGDYAAAVVDQIENAAFPQARITVGY
jgi:putative NADH-flavin reductase/pimeloyl-ACP methyl ester carboxylesterase